MSTPGTNFCDSALMASSVIIGLPPPSLRFFFLTGAGLPGDLEGDADRVSHEDGAVFAADGHTT